MRRVIRRRHQWTGPFLWLNRLTRSQHQIRLVVSSVLAPVRHQLDRYGISVDASYDTPGEALEAFENS